MKQPALFLPVLMLSGLFVLITNTVSATEYECLAYNDLRIIRLDYPGKDHLCEVSVTKHDGLPEVKWYANHDSQFCSTKLNELVAKYQIAWKFTCQRWPDRVGLDALSARHRSLVDSVVKQAIEEGKTASLPYQVTGVRISSTELDNKNATAIVAQIFLKNTAGDSNQSTNRTYYIVDDGTLFSTNIIPALEGNITPPGNGYRIDSAIVSAVLPSGQIEVNTTVLSPDNPDQPRCFGTQSFVPASKGTLESVNEHKYICNV